MYEARILGLIFRYWWRVMAVIICVFLNLLQICRVYIFDLQEFKRQGEVCAKINTSQTFPNEKAGNIVVRWAYQDLVHMLFNLITVFFKNG